MGAIIASPDGVQTGRGSMASPLDLSTALSASSPVRPGGTVLLRGGRYRGLFVSKLAGVEDRPIIVRSYPGEWAVLDGGTEVGSVLEIQGSDTWFKDFEVMRSDPHRRSEYPGNTPPDISRSRFAGIDTLGARTRLINLIVRDNGDGIGLWRPSGESVVYGCVVFNNGWIGPDHSWGHAIYVQNQTGTKVLEDNVMFNNYGEGVNAYALRGPVEGIEVVGSTSFENGAPAGTREPNILVGAEVDDTDRVLVDRSVFYHRPSVDGINAYLGYPQNPRVMSRRVALSFTGNVVAGGSRPLIASSFEAIDVERNLILGTPRPSAWRFWLVEWTPKEPAALAPQRSYRWDHNVYRATVESTTAPLFRLVEDNNDRSVSFDRWQSETGFDSSTTFAPGKPTGQRIVIRPNRYERGRALVTILNWTDRQSATVDLSNIGLKRGEPIEIRDVQDLAADPVYRGTYIGKPVRIPLATRSVMQPVGAAKDTLSHTPTDFGSFLILPAAQSRVLAAGLRRAP